MEFCGVILFLLAWIVAIVLDVGTELVIVPVGGALYATGLKMQNFWTFLVDRIRKPFYHHK